MRLSRATTPRRRRAVCVLSVGLLVIALGCGSNSPGRLHTRGGAAGDDPQHRLGVHGTSLTLDGKPWWPIGINAYQLGTDWKINAGCGAEVDLERYFGSLPSGSLSRVNVYSAFAVNKHTGQLDFSRLDAIFAAAERHDQLLIGVLTGGDGGCENDYFKNEDWYRSGWRSEVSHGLPMPFEAWLNVAVQRWSSSPALAGWTPVGEPEPSSCTDASCTWQTRLCPPDAALVLRTFFDEVGSRIRSLDRDVLTFSGHTGGSQCGSAADEYQMVAASAGIDVVEYHFYEASDYVPGNPRDGLRRRVEQARAVNKPLLVAEIGVAAGACNTLEDRRREVSSLVTAARTHGAAGVMFWSYVPDPRLDQCTFDIGPDDPLLDMVGTGA
ncbi:beta-mannosidase [Mycolicibacterium sediminis]|uniref:beta-mannosidase n=1 Tax=Mycolicibacterium sediminis TaxID=1286180 RepID=UPI0013CF494E|nr:beta-mannosidase [Mycolicibacterium sediminis]